jgi:hypothetical protein
MNSADRNKENPVYTVKGKRLMENFAEAYQMLAKADASKDKAGDKITGALQAFHAAFVESGENPGDFWDNFAQENDFVREVPLMAEGKPIMKTDGTIRKVRVGTVQPTASARTAVSAMRKVYATDGNIASDWKECRKRYAEIRKAEQSVDAIAAKAVKAFMKYPPAIRAAILAGQKKAMLAEQQAEQLNGQEIGRKAA